MKTSRRGFIRSALAAGVFPFVPACTTRRVFGEGDKVRLACVGISNQGWYDIKEFAKTGLCEFSAFCDTDMGSKRTAECLKAYPDVPRFQDFRRMLDAMDGRIDAVAVMIPDFSHFPVTMEAMRRGLAVYVEKPLAPPSRSASSSLPPSGSTAWSRRWATRDIPDGTTTSSPTTSRRESSIRSRS